MLYHIIFIIIILFYLFQININVDKNAYYANTSRNLIEEKIYEEIKYFIAYNHNQSDRMFTYIYKINTVRPPYNYLISSFKIGDFIEM